MAACLAVVFGVSFAANAAGISLFGPPKTRIVISYGGEKLDFFTTKKKMSEALAERGINLSAQDKTSFSLDAVLNGKAVMGSIDKALPVTIYDGYTRISGRSTSIDPGTIIADNAITVWPEDRVTSDITLDPVATKSVGVVVRIDRAPTYIVSIDDRIIEVRSWEPQTDKILASAKVTINPQDEISPSKGTVLLPGDEVVVTRINEIDLPITSEIAFETENTTSSAVAFGQSKMIQEGAKGVVKKTYRVTYKNGVEVSRWLLSSTVTTPVKNKIIARGVVTGRANFGYYDGMVTSFYKGYAGRYLLVTNLQNGKQVKVKIIGSGPFNGPLMDMGTEPFKAIGGTLSGGFLPNVSVSLLD